MKQKTKSKVLLIANLLMLFMLLGTSVYAFVWNKEVNTDIGVEVSTEETLKIMNTEKIGDQNEGLKLIPQNAHATHENERKKLVYTVEIALVNESGEDLVNELGEEDLVVEVNPGDYLYANVDKIVKGNNAWTVTITVELNRNFNNPEKFKDIEGKSHKIHISFTLTTIPDQE